METDNEGISLNNDVDAVDFSKSDSVLYKMDKSQERIKIHKSIPLDNLNKKCENTLMDSLADNGSQELTIEDSKEFICEDIPLQEEFKENSVNEEITMCATLDFMQYSFVEIGRRLWSSTKEEQHFTKGCLWSPDGSCILLPVNLDGMHIIELPNDMYTIETMSQERQVSELESAVHIKEAGTVYDIAWYPFMYSGLPETCCWISTRQHDPIQMWDAFNGELRCSYRGYDEVDEVEPAISVSFSNDGQKVMGGYKKSIKIFDTNVPGRNCTILPVKQTVSCFAKNNHKTNAVTTGSWNGYIHYYDLRNTKVGPLFTLGGHSAGVTWLEYAPNGEDYLLFSGARKDSRILVWDMRNYAAPWKIYNRTVETNQRIYFDIDSQKKWLISGGTDGIIKAWDLTKDYSHPKEISMHSDCCNGINFHPTRPILATSSGQYHFLSNIDDADNVVTQTIIPYENSLVLTWFGRSLQNL